jgi:transposase-like protein
MSSGVGDASPPALTFSVPDRAECPRCHKTELVRHENVTRGNDPYVNYKCGACRYSWQVKDAPKRPAKTEK